MMPGRTGFTVAGFFERVARVLQALADGPLGGLRAMLNRLARFCCGFLYGFASFFDWTLILGPHRERYATRQNDN
jgi:hypothetical protein